MRMTPRMKMCDYVSGKIENVGLKTKPEKGMTKNEKDFCKTFDAVVLSTMDAESLELLKKAIIAAYNVGLERSI